jgi:hypothetical protein
VQLYSVRTECEKDLPGTIKAVAKMGYKGVEFAGYYGRDAKTLKKLLDGVGLKCCGTLGIVSHIGCLLRMLLLSRTWNSQKCLLLWKKQSGILSFLKFRLAVSMLPTNDTEHGLLPTPTAIDANPVTGGNLFKTKSGSIRARYKNTSSNRGLAALGLAHPTYEEWMMGFPTGWTDCDFSATRLSRKSRRKSSGQ